MSLFDNNEEILEKLEAAESRVERVRIDGEAAAEDKAALAAEIKSYILQLAANVEQSGGDIQLLGGALVVADLLDVLKRYQDVFAIRKLDHLVDDLRQLWEAAG